MDSEPIAHLDTEPVPTLELILSTAASILILALRTVIDVVTTFPRWHAAVAVLAGEVALGTHTLLWWTNKQVISVCGAHRKKTVIPMIFFITTGWLSQLHEDFDWSLYNIMTGPPQLQLWFFHICLNPLQLPDITGLWQMHFQWNCPKENAKRHSWWLVNISSGNGLVPSGKKSLLEVVLASDLCGHVASLGHKELITVWSQLGIITTPSRLNVHFALTAGSPLCTDKLLWLLNESSVKILQPAYFTGQLSSTNVSPQCCCVPVCAAVPTHHTWAGLHRCHPRSDYARHRWSHTRCRNHFGSQILIPHRFH